MKFPAVKKTNFRKNKEHKMKTPTIATLSVLLLVGLFGLNVHAEVFDHNADFKAFDANFAHFNDFQHDFQFEQRSFRQAHPLEFVAFAHQEHFATFEFAKFDFVKSFDNDLSARQGFVAHVNAHAVEFADFGFQKTRFEGSFGSFEERFNA
jgi:hypothetical protein